MFFICSLCLACFDGFLDNFFELVLSQFYFLVDLLFKLIFHGLVYHKFLAIYDLLFDELNTNLLYIMEKKIKILLQE